MFFFLINIFLFLFLPHCSAAGPEPDFPLSSFRFIPHWQVRLALCITAVTGPFRGWVLIFFCCGDVCQFLWSHGTTHTCCAFLSTFSDNLISPFFFLFCPHLSLTYFFFFNFSSSLTHVDFICLFIKQPYVSDVPLFPASQGTFGAFEFVSNLAHQPQWICLKKMRDVSKISDQSLA